MTIKFRNIQMIFVIEIIFETPILATFDDLSFMCIHKI